MTLHMLDYFFPFFVFFYGILLLFVLENSFLYKIAEKRLPEALATMRGHKTLAWICFFGGGLWTLQNVLLA